MDNNKKIAVQFEVSVEKVKSLAVVLGVDVKDEDIEALTEKPLTIKSDEVHDLTDGKYDAATAEFAFSCFALAVLKKREEIGADGKSVEKVIMQK